MSLQTSNFDYVAVSSDLQANTIKVVFDYQLSDYQSIACSIALPSFGHQSRSHGSSAPLNRHDWLKIDQGFLHRR